MYNIIGNSLLRALVAGVPTVGMQYILVLLFLYSLSSSTTAAPHKREESSLLQARQTNPPSCSQNSDCFPANFPNNTVVPIHLVECPPSPSGEFRRCFCDQCFTTNRTINRCYIENPQCYFYDLNGDSLQCVDRRRSQVVAFALSLTLSGFGVANFYIGQNGLGGAQLFLFLFVFAATCAVICIPCCAFCIASSEDRVGCCLAIIILTIILVTVLLICDALAMWAWWIGDAVIFGTNQRLAGDGCPLRPDL